MSAKSVKGLIGLPNSPLKHSKTSCHSRTDKSCAMMTRKKTKSKPSLKSLKSTGSFCRRSRVSSFTKQKSPRSKKPVEEAKACSYSLKSKIGLSASLRQSFRPI